MKQASIQALAVIGFVTVLFFGMVFAVYLARFVPTAVSGLTAAAVSLGQVFVPANNNNVIIADNNATSTTDIVLPIATSTDTNVDANVDTGDSNNTDNNNVATTPSNPTAGNETTSSVNQPGNDNTPTIDPNGLPNLTPSILATGIMTGTSTDSFVETKEITSKDKVGVRFVIENTGTNVAKDWSFNVILPTSVAYTFESDKQQDLNPGDKIEYTIGFDKAKVGKDMPISVTVDQKKLVNESNENDNSAFADITVTSE